MQEEFSSPYIEESEAILADVLGKPLSGEERKKATIELAQNILKEAKRIQTSKEKRQEKQLAKMMHDPIGKCFTTSMMDECFRSRKKRRIANQLIFLLEQLGVPSYLSFPKRMAFYFFKNLPITALALFVPLLSFMIRKEASSLILPAKKGPLLAHIRKRKAQGVRINLNHLGEAILAEKEAEERVNEYLVDLEKEEIEYVSIKISAIFSQIHLLGWEKTSHLIAERLRMLYRAAIKHPTVDKKGNSVPKFINLDMEEYRDLILTKEIFKEVLEEKEFENLPAGIVLQAYIPDSFEIQKELTHWAKERVKKGHAPIKIRIVKGANLAMEQVESSIRGWKQAPYTAKIEVDANYKKMIHYGFLKENAEAAHIGVASHNLFEIAYALILKAENDLKDEVSFEMLEGMADHIRRAVQKLTKDILLYCPVVAKKDFHAAVAYLFRRFDENTGPDNFLKHLFSLEPGTEEWKGQALFFSKSCDEVDAVMNKPRRTQNRFHPSEEPSLEDSFHNEADTDFSLPQNRMWGSAIKDKWHNKKVAPIPLVIGGKEIEEKEPKGKGFDPSYPKEPLYSYSMATWDQIDEALNIAKVSGSTWSAKSAEERALYIHKAANKLHEKRDDLIGVMMLDGGKALLEGDPEVSEAIDFAFYYAKSILKMDRCKDIKWEAKGTILVAPPWNFPVAIPAGGIFGALAAGNAVIFKPAPEAVLSGWILVNALWEAGIPKDVLQFINCEDEKEGSLLIQDPRLNAVILTGATSTALLFSKLRPGLDLSAETGGKNALIITASSDRDQAIKDLIQSAFGHSGQKCSAASLAILEAEVYDDPNFKKHLRDAAISLTVGSAWDLSSKVTPLIREPSEDLLRGLTTLDRGEFWLLEPKQNKDNPNLWSPGIKWGVKKDSFMHQTELFGPVLGVMRAKNLGEAVELANGTRYGLTSGIHALDAREQKYWMENIEAGNCYVNRGTTGAIVRRQPFGGFKESCFGKGSKAGGPNYVAQFAKATQVALPHEKDVASDKLNRLNKLVKREELTAEDLGYWVAGIESYTYHAKHFAKMHDPSLLLGEDNLFCYKPHKKITFRIQEKDKIIDVFKVFAAALSVECPLEVSFSKTSPQEWKDLMPHFTFLEESEDAFEARVEAGTCKRARLIGAPKESLIKAASASCAFLDAEKPLANGRFELLHYLREVSYSITYHRYGNLGLREGEKRKGVS